MSLSLDLKLQANITNDCIYLTLITVALVICVAAIQRSCAGMVLVFNVVHMFKNHYVNFGKISLNIFRKTNTVY